MTLYEVEGTVTTTGKGTFEAETEEQAREEFIEFMTDGTAEGLRYGEKDPPEATITDIGETDGIYITVKP